MNPVPCPSCGLIEDWPENPLKPYCSEVCRLLWSHGLAWRIQPYRIVVDTHPHLIVQAGPRFDLRESVLEGTRERVLAAERKRRQRERFRSPEMSRQVTPTTQYNPPIEGDLAILGPNNCEAGIFPVIRGLEPSS
jgi:endogenous inhibitor of DNA gyrase (YacG/DUF329 family)